jgi:tRNA A37 threonylcarbamoyladenosine dehydratase
VDRKERTYSKKEGLDNLKKYKCIGCRMGGVGSLQLNFQQDGRTMTIVDGDVVDITKINRQLPVTFDY